jgi:hypothetical protein
MAIRLKFVVHSRLRVHIYLKNTWRVLGEVNSYATFEYIRFSVWHRLESNNEGWNGFNIRSNPICALH